MRVARWYNNRDVRLEEMPVPQIGPDEMLVRVEACGVCGSDVMEWYRLDRAPLVLGHEIGGQVAAVGKAMKSYREGDRVAVAHHVPCNTCHYCLSGHHTVCDTLRRTNVDPGGFAEYVRLSSLHVNRGVFTLPDTVSYEAATLVEPLACVLRAQRIANLKPGMSVLVMGSGVTGLLNVLLARAQGAGRIMATDVNQYRLKAAERFGAEAAFHADDDVTAGLLKVNEGWLADLVKMCTGATSAIGQALAVLERGGVVMLFAPTNPGASIEISVNDLFFRNDITLATSYAASPADYRTALELIRGGVLPIEQLITHRLGLKEAGRGFELVAEAGSSLKVVIKPQR